MDACAGECGKPKPRDPTAPRAAAAQVPAGYPASYAETIAAAIPRTTAPRGIPVRFADATSSAFTQPSNYHGPMAVVDYNHDGQQTAGEPGVPEEPAWLRDGAAAAAQNWGATYGGLTGSTPVTVSGTGDAGDTVTRIDRARRRVVTLHAVRPERSGIIDSDVNLA